MIDLLKALCLWLKQGTPVVTATIVTHEGSTPRSAGSTILERDAPAHEAIAGRLDRALAMFSRVDRETRLPIRIILKRAGLYCPPKEFTGP
jgi:xanthine/CO dehydrogenase XdhC/CoxF family maturation factor